MAFPPTSSPLARALAERDYNDPTPVQLAVLDAEAVGRDLLVSAQTGSGKTVAYGLALGETLLGDAELLGQAGEPVALIVAPTRELALQVNRELTWLYHYAGARVASCVGGMDPRQERRELLAGCHIVVGTPGRLRDHLERGSLKVSALKAVVLDEADEMLDLGFREDLEFILQTTPEERRTLMFSATLPKAIVALAKNYQQNALRIQASGPERAHADIEYRVVRIAANDMEHAVVNLLRFFETPSALVFCNTRETVRHLQAILLERGFSVVSLSGELSQSERNHALQALRDGRARVCVATDVAARGIDLPNLGLVVHAELPNDAEVLQHRSGRTGRAGRKGVSILLVPPSRRRRAEQLLTSGRIQASWGVPPTADDIRKLDQERLLQSPLLTDPGTEEDIAMAKALLAVRSAEDVATALARIYRLQLPAPEDVADPGNARENRERPEPGGRKEHGRRERREPREPHGGRERQAAREPYAGREPQGPREPARARATPSGKTVWFRLNIGRQKNADPRWLVPVICNQGNITKQDIGAIRIADRDTQFEVDESVAEAFAEAVRRVKKGDVRIEPLGEGETQGARPAPPKHRKPHGKPSPKSGWDPKPGGKPPTRKPPRG